MLTTNLGFRTYCTSNDRDGSRIFGEKEERAGAVGSGRVRVGGLGKSRFRNPPMLLLNVWK